MTYRVEKKKWILYRHTKDYNIIKTVAKLLKESSNIDNDSKIILQENLKHHQMYSERNKDKPLDAINHRINTLAYYLFGYKTKRNNQNSFMFSPLGNLFLKYIDNPQELSKIFFTMLWGVQFPHPHGGNKDDGFSLYPFRLIFTLLMDCRLNNKLYVPEVAYFVMFQRTIDLQTYEQLVKNILEFRNKNVNEIIQLFKQAEHVLVNAVYEWDYYTTELFETAGIFKKTRGETLATLSHGTSSTRKLTMNYIQIEDNLSEFYEKLQSCYPLTESPVALNSSERLSSDIVKEIYNFYPPILLEELGEQVLELLELPKLIEQYSKNEDNNDATRFEHVLTNGFNMFYNIEAEHIGGAGKPDVECLYSYNIGEKKFVVEAKSTKNKLLQINAGRLKTHRKNIKGEYTIVITSRYVPAVKNDIKGEDIVILTASTFAEYLYNNINNNIREIDFNDFDNIIVNNFGKDISPMISDLTSKKFSILTLTK